MAAYVIFDVDIKDMNRYQEFMKSAKPAIEAAGGKYLARGGAHKVYEGDWEPRRIVLFEFPSVAAFESFYNGNVVPKPQANSRCMQFSQARFRGGLDVGSAQDGAT